MRYNIQLKAIIFQSVCIATFTFHRLIKTEKTDLFKYNYTCTRIIFSYKCPLEYNKMSKFHSWGFLPIWKDDNLFSKSFNNNFCVKYLSFYKTFLLKMVFSPDVHKEIAMAKPFEKIASTIKKMAFYMAEIHMITCSKFSITPLTHWYIYNVSVWYMSLKLSLHQHSGIKAKK